MRAISSRWEASIEGLSAENAASILVVGLVLGTFPIFGLPTLLCGLASLILRINFPALQLVNQLCWPLQIALLIPCVRLGSRIFAFPHGLATPVTLKLGASALQAVTGWFCICVPLGVLLYFALASALRRCGTRTAEKTIDTIPRPTLFSPVNTPSDRSQGFTNL